MKIYSPFHDYYDCMLASSHSEEPIYIRKPVEITIRANSSKFNYIDNHLISFGLLFFCDDWYPYVNFMGTNFFTFDSFSRFLNGKMKQKAWDVFRERHLDSYENHFLIQPGRWYTKPASYYWKEEILNRKPVGCPIVDIRVENKNEIYRENPILKDIGFQKVFPPRECFSKLEQWLSNIALPDPGNIQVEDKYLIQSKGFDKWSFRKQSRNSKGGE